MSNIVIKSYNLHRLSIHDPQPQDVAAPQNQSSLFEYLETIVEEVVDSSRRCGFVFNSPTELVERNLLDLIVQNETFENVSENLANKLHSEELNSQSRNKNLTYEIKKGVLIQVFFEIDNQDYYLIIKVDDNKFFDMGSLSFSDGLPTEKARTQKAALISFLNNQVDELFLLDSNSKISSYWYKDFLKASAINSSEDNTKKSFVEIDKVLSKIKKISSVDYWLIRNDVISYYRNNSGFVYDDVVSRIKGHVFENKEVLEAKVTNYDDTKSYSIVDVYPAIETTLQNLPAQKKFDTQFDLQTGVIKARLVNKIVLDRYFDLSIKGDVEDLESKIVAGDDDDGKYIKIYSDEGYEQFYKG